MGQLCWSFFLFLCSDPFQYLTPCRLDRPGTTTGHTTRMSGSDMERCSFRVSDCTIANHRQTSEWHAQKWCLACMVCKKQGTGMVQNTEKGKMVSKAGPLLPASLPEEATSCNISKLSPLTTNQTFQAIDQNRLRNQLKRPQAQLPVRHHKWASSVEDIPFPTLCAYRAQSVGNCWQTCS